MTVYEVSFPLRLQRCRDRPFGLQLKAYPENQQGS
jgi:hypothetical protein